MLYIHVEDGFVVFTAVVSCDSSLLSLFLFFTSRLKQWKMINNHVCYVNVNFPSYKFCTFDINSQRSLSIVRNESGSGMHFLKFSGENNNNKKCSEVGSDFHGGCAFFWA